MLRESIIFHPLAAAIYMCANIMFGHPEIFSHMWLAAHTVKNYNVHCTIYILMYNNWEPTEGYIIFTHIFEHHIIMLYVIFILNILYFVDVECYIFFSFSFIYFITLYFVPPSRPLPIIFVVPYKCYYRRKLCSHMYDIVYVYISISTKSKKKMWCCILAKLQYIEINAKK